MTIIAPVDPWPALRWPDWQDTATTLHRWTQVVGKVKLARTPVVNHWWNVAFYVTSRGLTTSTMPHDDRTFEIDFDFVDHRVDVLASDGGRRSVALAPRSVASFHRDLMAALHELGLDVAIRPRPVEVPDTVPLDRDEAHRSYDPEAVERFFAALGTADRLMKTFRSRFIGKCSPVHFFWGSFDHAVTRFSGRTAPLHPGGVPNLPDRVTREAYSHEVSSCGFWPGGVLHPEPVFYSYAYPEPAGFRAASVPGDARWIEPLAEFVLPWDAARAAADPDRAVLDFFQRTYEAAADLGGWDRAALERRP
jgi:hypothetical protein